MPAAVCAAGESASWPRAGTGWPIGGGARDLLETALAASPLDDDYPVTTWTAADLTDQLGRHGWSVSTATVHRTPHTMGSVYRRPRHGLTHRQDAEAVPSARHVLTELHKRGLLPSPASGFSTWMRATSTPIPTWTRSGSGAAVP